MNNDLHYPAPSTVPLVSWNRKERRAKSLLQLWKNPEVSILRSRTRNNFWVESHADGPFDGDLQAHIRHPHRGSG